MGTTSRMPATGESKLNTSAGLGALCRLAAAIGADRSLVQGAGGNVSFKSGGTMWIKASGTWLADAGRSDIMVPVVLPASATGDFRVHDRDTTGLRPSIETSMHAALPHAVVLHVHSVDAIALAIRTDAATLLGEKLAGLRWAFIPYCRPGDPLARAIEAAAAGGTVDVLLLGNHGLVVAAQGVAEAEALLGEVVRRLSAAPRSIVEGGAPRFEGNGFHPPADSFIHSLATDPISLKIAEGGVLYPDHVVFLGAAPLVLDPGDDLADALERWRGAGRQPPKWVIVRGKAVAIADDIARGGEEMLRCLADVCQRLRTGEPLRFLGEADIAALLDWDAEKYRQKLAQTGA